MCDHTYDGRWKEDIPALTKPIRLSIAGFETCVEVTPSQLEIVVLPLLSILHGKLQEASRRLIAGLAGIPGSGKSTFAAIVEHVARQLPGAPRLQAFGIDGWHWPNRVLEQRTLVDEQGETVPLKRRKGSPASFDVESLAAALRRLRGAAQPVVIPVYDRRLHEPVPGGMTIDADTQIVLVEGNYLLADAAGFDQVRGELDIALCLACDPAVARRRVIDRHVRGGRSRDEADEKFEMNDRLNTDIVLASEYRATVRITMHPAPELTHGQDRS